MSNTIIRFILIRDFAISSALAKTDGRYSRYQCQKAVDYIITHYDKYPDFLFIKTENEIVEVIARWAAVRMRCYYKERKETNGNEKNMG